VALISGGAATDVWLPRRVELELVRGMARSAGACSHLELTRPNLWPQSGDRWSNQEVWPCDSVKAKDARGPTWQQVEQKIGPTKDRNANPPGATLAPTNDRTKKGRSKRNDGDGHSKIAVSRSTQSAVDRQLEQVHGASFDESEPSDPQSRRIDRHGDKPGLDRHGQPGI
jgi:hypothetical protein